MPAQVAYRICVQRSSIQTSSLDGPRVHVFALDMTKVLVNFRHVKYYAFGFQMMRSTHRLKCGTMAPLTRDHREKSLHNVWKCSNSPSTIANWLTRNRARLTISLFIAFEKKVEGNKLLSFLTELKRTHSTWPKRKYTECEIKVIERHGRWPF